MGRGLVSPEPAAHSNLLVPRTSSLAPGRSGFTLVELLVVIAVIAILGGMVLGGVMSAKRQANKSHTKMIIDLLGAAINQYQDDWGDYPPGSAEVSGAEDLYSAMTSSANTRTYISGGQPPAAVPEGSNRRVFVDHWRSPIRYTHHRHYSGEPRADDYRLQSAGPDGRFGTDDDITNWKK